MPGKYAPLKIHLLSRSENMWYTTFKELETILGFSLPQSAFKHQAWWSNANEEGQHSHALSWTSVGWRTSELNLKDRHVMFLRHSRTEGVPRPNLIRSKQSTACEANATQEKTYEAIKYEWDFSTVPNYELEMAWSHAGAINVKNGRLAFPMDIPNLPGLYRLRIKYASGVESRYVGETDNLRRRFGHYRNPGPKQATNIRLNEIMLKGLSEDAEVAISILTENAWIIQNGQRSPADLSIKSVRRLFENFVQLAERHESIDTLNL